MMENPLSDQNDVWTYIWGEKYTPSQFYGKIDEHITIPFHWLWKFSCVMKTKVSLGFY
jgi:hypothetical protein